MFRIILPVLAAALPLMAALPDSARAVPMLSSGVQTNQSAGAGQTQSRHAGAVMHNPANLVSSPGDRISLEITALNVKHRYIPAGDENPIAKIDMVAPPLSTGASWSLPEAGLAFGFMLTPSGTGSETEYENIPVPVGTSTATQDVTSSTEGYDLGVGVGLRKERIRLGVSVINSYVSNTLRTYMDGVDLIETEYRGFYFQPLFGLGLDLTETWTVAFSYQPAQLREHSGGGTSNLGDLDAPVDYRPSRFGLGLAARTGVGEFFMDGLFEQFSAGRNLKRSATSVSSLENDLRDTFQISIGSRLATGLRGQSFTVAASVATGNLGDGEVERNEQGKNVTVVSGGGTFGDFEAMERRTFVLGWTGEWDSFAMNLLGRYVYGRREVPYYHPGEGLYELSTTSLGMGFDYKI